MNQTQTPLLGPDAIRAALKTMPPSPGVYRMIAADDRILYIGKAKNLANRVASYANPRDFSTRLMRMVAQIARVEFIVTKSEAEALLVEANLVRRHAPRYNILLKDDKSFPYLLINRNHPYPRIEKHRGAQNKPGEYFGPFASVGALNETMGLLQKIFLLRPCSDTYFKNRSRPCLQYQIKRCSAPCVNYISEAEYGEKLISARDFLKGRHRDVQEALAQEMNAASEAYDYEKAALLRDRIRALTQVQQEQGLRVAGLHDADIIAFVRRGARSVAQVSFYRQGSHFGQQSFQPTHEAEASDGDVMAAFLAQFYQAHTPPPEILVNLLPSECELLAEALSLGSSPSERQEDGGRTTESTPPPIGGRMGGGRRGQSSTYSVKEEQVTPPSQPSAYGGRGYQVTIRQPQRGDKLTLVTQAKASAEAVLARAEMEHAAIATNLARLQELFQLPRPPQRIEVYDNSHIMGTSALGAFIVATPEGFDKRGYRTFNIKDLETKPGDDYAMMREVFRRRFKARRFKTTDANLTSSSPLAGEPKSPSAAPGDSVGGQASPTDQSSEYNAPSSPPTKSQSDLAPPQGGSKEASSLAMGEGTYPDLVLIDGGLGQLNAVMEALAGYDVRAVTFVAIAKGEDRNAGREWFFQPGREPFQLPPNDAALHYLQRLRDEAHRFAIGRHRNKRSAKFTTSSLDDIPGIGSTRKRALLQHFGSRASVERASLAELENVTGISKTTAKSIYDFFHG